MGETDATACEGRIDVVNYAGVWVLSLHGEHDLSTQPSLGEQLGYVRQAGGPVVVDFSDVESVDSTVIGAVTRSRKGDPGQLAIVVPAHSRSTDLIRLVEGPTPIPVYPTVDAATAALTNP